jgi:arsenate reductase (thioredoxin)
MKKSIAFVCQHGSAKSLIAAEYAGVFARKHSLDLTATTSGPEPDSEVPPNVIEGLLRHGIDTRSKVPQRVTAEALARGPYRHVRVRFERSRRR